MERPVGPTTLTAVRSAICVVLHDVSPARWNGCQRVLAELQDCAERAGVSLPITLLVVPRMHGDPNLPASYLRGLRQLAHTGHELALHGLTHRDEGPAPRGLRDRLLRRHYTAGEGEFAALPAAQATQRLREGRAWASTHGLVMHGFVAPAWLLGPAGLQAAVDTGFCYTCTLNEVIALPQRQGMPTPSLVFSSRAAWRRGLSVVWNALLARRARMAPLLRLELHPGDADHASVMRCWKRLLDEELRTRFPLRLDEAAQLARQIASLDSQSPCTTNPSPHDRSARVARHVGDLAKGN
jgi:uncharacterized protein